VATATEVLLDLGRFEEAKNYAMRALRFSAGRADGVRYHGVRRALALAEAMLGEYDVARARIGALIGERVALGTTGVYLGILYEAAALVAVRSGDAAEFERWRDLTREEYLRREPSGFAGRYQRLLDAAERAGLSRRVSVPPASVRTQSFLADVATVIESTMEAPGHPEARAQRGLRLLCERGGASSGYLYLLRDAGLALAAKLGAEDPEPELGTMVSDWLDEEIAGYEPSTTVIEPETTALGSARWTTSDGHVFHPVTIRASLAGESRPVGVAALGYDDSTEAVGSVARMANALGDYFLRVGEVTIMTSRPGI
jgi:hypothetical protein